MRSGPNTFDLNALLRRFGLIIYTGDPEGDLLLIEDEIRELYERKLIEKEEFLQALAAVNDRRQRLKE